MILYVQSKAFPMKTFLAVVQPEFTIARVRAQILHILYDIGREDHQFRLRFNGQYLKDSLTIRDYNLSSNFILKMVPMSKSNASLFDVRSVSSDEFENGGESNRSYDARDALLEEVHKFEKRASKLSDLKFILSMHFVVAVLGLVSNYWYSSFWLTPYFLLGTLMAPSFSRSGGYMGLSSIYRNYYCIVGGIFSILVMGAAAALSALTWIKIITHGCPGWSFTGDCSYENIYTAVLFSVDCILVAVTAGLLFHLYHNFKFEVGDRIATFLCQSRDVSKLVVMARRGQEKEKRFATFELSTLAGSSDENKRRIHSEAGFSLLVSLALSKDSATQEYSVEILGELLTLQDIQSQFVASGSTKMLTALFHSPSPKVVLEAVTALSYLVADSEDHKMAVIEDTGLDDLSVAAKCDWTSIQRIVAGIYLDLSFNPEVRGHLACRNKPAQTLISLSSSKDEETMRVALQALELLAIESSNMICAQRELIPVLINVPFTSGDEKLLLVAAKLLLYFAENRETCEEMLQTPRLTDCLRVMAGQKMAVALQKVVCKIAFCSVAEFKDLRVWALSVKLDKILELLKENTADMEVWDNADQCLLMIRSNTDLDLPTLTTEEKMKRMSSVLGSGLIERISLSASSTSSLRKTAASDSDHKDRAVSSTSVRRSEVGSLRSLRGSSASVRVGS